MAVVALLTTLAACGDGGGAGDESRSEPSPTGTEVIGTTKSGCDLPVLVHVPENWGVESVTPKMVERADDERLTSPGGFEWVCSILGSPVGIPAPIFIFVAPPRVARDLTAEQLLQRYVRAAYGDVKVDVRDVTVDAGPGVEGTFSTSRGRYSPVQLSAFVLPTPTGAVVVINGGPHQETIDRGLPAYESVRDSMVLHN